MAQRLPVPGSDDNTWGDILNGFLGVVHNADGTLKTGSVTSDSIADGTITTSDISSTAGITKAQLATSVQTSLSAADAAAPNSNVVHLTGNETVAGTKTFSSQIVASSGVSSPNVTTSSSSMTIQQTGDQYGSTSFQLLNRNNFNGMFVQVGANDLADLILAGSSGVSSNVRFEHRGTNIADPNNTGGEFQFGSPASGQGVGSWFNAGPTSSIVKANLGVSLPTNGSPNSTLQVAGSMSLPYVAKTAAYTASNKDYLIDCTSNSFTVTLPTAAGITGRQYAIKNSGTGTITVATTSSQTIDGATTYTLSTQYQGVIVESNGTNWEVLATAGAAVGDATSTSKGIVQLTGDLGGTAASPTTPTAVHITGNETIAGVKTFNSSPTIPTPSATTDAANKSYVDTAVSSVGSSLSQAASQTASFTAVAGKFYPVNATSGAITVTLPTSTGSQILVIKKTDSSSNVVTLSGTINGASTTLPLRYQNQAKELIADGGGGWSVEGGDIDIAATIASSALPGFVQMAGDFGGTGSSPLVAKLNGVTLNTTAPSAGQVLQATSATAAAWTTPTGGSGTDNTKVLKSGDTMTGTLTMPNLNSITTQTPPDIYQWFYSDSKAYNQVPFGELWHDLLAFGKLYTVTSETTTNGSTWTSATVNKKLFAHLENQSIQVMDGTVQGIRWTFSNTAYSSGTWLLIAYAFVSSPPQVTIYVQSSTDGSTWTNRHNSQYTPGTKPVWHFVQDNGGDGYTRISIQGAGTIKLSSIRFYSPRWGDQGAGKEIEQPYTWNENGYIGIGSGFAAPNYPLDVTGDASVAGQIHNVTNPTSAQDVATKAYVDSTASSGVADATTTTKGKIQLAGDLGGTADTPYILGSTGTVYNYVYNPSFESGYASWTNYGAYGSIARDNTFSQVGSYSSKQSNSTAQDGGMTSAAISLNAGTYNFSIYAKMTSDVTNASLAIRVAGGGATIWKTNIAYTTANWTQYGTDFTLSSAQSIEILIGIGSFGSTSTGTVWYDAVSVQAGSGATTYFDGNTASSGSTTYAWTGTANNSQSTKSGRARLQSTDQLPEGSSNKYFTTARAWTSPTLTGTVTIPDPVNSTDAATKAYVDANAGGGSAYAVDVSSIGLPIVGTNGITVTETASAITIGYSGSGGAGGSQSVGNSNTYTAVTLGTPDYATNVYTVPANSYVTLPLNTIVSDAYSNFSTSTYLYTVPATGTYLITASVRMTDNDAGSYNFGLGVNTTAADGKWFKWMTSVGNTNHKAYDYTRIDTFNQGDKLRLFTYTSSAYYLNQAALQIIRLDTIGSSGGSGSGGNSRTVAQVSSAMTAAAVASTDYIYYWSGATAYALTLPTAVGNTGRYTLKNSSTVSQVVLTTSSQTIDGGTSITISAGNSVDLISNNTNWMVI